VVEKIKLLKHQLLKSGIIKNKVMGYRNYLGSLPKREYNKIKKMSIQELYEHKGEVWSEDYDDGYVGVYDVAYNRHYELGKYVDSFPKKFFKPVFKNKETQEYFTEEHEFYIVQKEFVEELIKYYTEKIRKHYREILEPFFDGDKTREGFLTKKDIPLTEKEVHGVYNLINHVKGMAMEWGVTGMFDEWLPYSLEHDDIVTSWKYEYAIFNLVDLYKKFDWKKNIMIYYGY
jgi:hypothetical protein